MFLDWLRTFQVLAPKVFHLRNPLKPKWFAQDCSSFKMESPMSWKPLFSEGKLGSLLPYQTGHVFAALPKWDEWRLYSRKLWWEDKMSMSLGDVDCPCCGVHPTQSGYMQEIQLLEKNTQALLNDSEVSAALAFSLPEYHPSLTYTH